MQISMQALFVKGVTEVNFSGLVFTKYVCLLLPREIEAKLHSAHASATTSAPRKFRRGLDLLHAGWIDDKGITDDAKMRNRRGYQRNTQKPSKSLPKSPVCVFARQAAIGSRIASFLPALPQMGVLYNLFQWYQH